MRRLLTASLIGLALLATACGSSDDDKTETGAGKPASSTTVAAGGAGAPSTTATTAKPKVDGPGCKALKGYLNAELIARRKLEEGVGDSKEQLVVGLDNTSGKVKQNFPQMADKVEARAVFVKAQLDGAEPTPEQTAAADDALKVINNYLAANCAPPAKNGAAAPGASSTTAAPTTTAP